MRKTREMNTVSRNQALRQLPLALLPVLAAMPASAQQATAGQQRDTAVVRTVSVWQKDVDQLRMDIMTQRKIELEYQKMLSTLQMRLQGGIGHGVGRPPHDPIQNGFS